MIADILLTLAALFAAQKIRSGWPASWPAIFQSPLADDHLALGWYLTALVLWGVVFLFTSVYDPKRNVRVVDELQLVILATLFSAVVFAGLFYLTKSNISRGLFLIFVLLDLILLISWRIVLRTFMRRRPGEIQKILIIGAGETGNRICQTIRAHDPTRLRPIGFLDDNPDVAPADLPLLGSTYNIRQVVEAQRPQHIVIALPLHASQRVVELAQSVADLPVKVHIIPDYFKVALYQAQVEVFGGIPMVNLREPALNDVQRMIKRIFDIVVSGGGLLVISPLLLTVALAIKLDSEGPVFFKQNRVGENGRFFKMLKFRSMVVNAEQLQSTVNVTTDAGQVLHKKADDPRITRVGRFIRRTSIDELPQLLNIFWGDMSLVGPRPELPWLVEAYEPWQRARFAVPQGLTGWWQVNGRSDKPMHLHTEEDLFYIRNYSLWLDLYILLKTPLVVLRGKGAY